MTDLVSQVRAGSRRALARLLTLIENERDGADKALAALFPYTGNAWIVGVTGAPGTGKSSLVNALAQAYRRHDRTVAILAVDPTSPFSGGAILGDRIRMRDLSGDPGVFIRSVATRGSLGGLARTARDLVRVMDAAGFDIVLVETVGAGQSEVDIVRTAHTTIVVEAPGLGDDVQAIKAGILEIADILVVNKADRPGAQNTIRALRAMIELGHPAARTPLRGHHGAAAQPEPEPDDNPIRYAPMWIPPIVPTVATAAAQSDESGVEVLVEAINDHAAAVADAATFRQLEQQRLEIELANRLREAVYERLMDAVTPGEIAALIEQIQTRQIDPRSAVKSLLEKYTHFR